MYISHIFMYICFSAISRALATRVGHLLGADQPHRIKACIIVTVSGTISIVAFDAVLMYALKSRIAQHFTTDAEVQAAVLELMPVACASHLFAVRKQHYPTYMPCILTNIMYRVLVICYQQS